MVKDIIFDFDGVIVESVDIKTDAFRKLFEHAGDETVRRIVAYHTRHGGVSRFEKFRHIYREFLRLPLSDAEFADLCDRFSQLVFEAVVKAPFVAGADRFLKNACSRYRFFVATGTPQVEIERIVDRRGLKKYFLGIYGSPRSKSDIVKTVLESHSISPEDAVYVGDTLTDYDAARDHGVRFIARVKDGDGLLKDASCVKIPDLSDLEGVLRSL